MVKKLMVWLLCAAMLPAAALAALPAVKQLATTVPVYDPMGGIKMGISGLFERAITVSGTNRTVKLYVPEGAVLGAYMVVMTVPSGVATVPWLVDSGWIGLADRQKFLLYVFEPGESGTWGAADAEQSYIETAYNNISVNTTAGRGTWYLPPESYYVVGYGAAGAALHKLVMKDPTLVAAAAFVDASDIGSEYLAQMSSNFFPTPDWNGNAVASSSVPLPVWIISGDISGNTGGVIEYWKKANQSLSMTYDSELITLWLAGLRLTQPTLRRKMLRSYGSLRGRTHPNHGSFCYIECVCKSSRGFELGTFDYPLPCWK